MTQNNEMPGEVFLIPTKKETGFDVAGWDFLLDENKDDEAITTYIRRAVTKEEAGEALKWQDGVIDRDFVKWALAHESLIRKLLEAHK